MVLQRHDANDEDDCKQSLLHERKGLQAFLEGRRFLVTFFASAGVLIHRFKEIIIWRRADDTGQVR
ncbi:hypothetical protein BKN49_05235 [Pseudomonas aeruginosa]|nr:hypothetical protein BKN49_05235 [Pseudomonas aeruginosa]